MHSRNSEVLSFNLLLKCHKLSYFDWFVQLNTDKICLKKVAGVFVLVFVEIHLLQYGKQIHSDTILYFPPSIDYPQYQ